MAKIPQKTAARSAPAARAAPVAAAIRPTPAPAPVPAINAGLSDIYEEYAGAGVSTRARDNIIPSIKLLQPLSPEVVEHKVTGAQGGDLLLSGVGLVSGEEGIWVQPCCMVEDWREFIPRDSGGGYVASYPVQYDNRDQIIPPPGAVQSSENKFRFFFEESGNSCIHYRVVPVIVWQADDNGETIGSEYVMSFFGTGHTIAKSWNTKWVKKRHSSRILPAFSHLYRATTTRKTNSKGTWFVYSFDEGHLIDQCGSIVGEPRAAVMMAAALYDAFKRGEKTAEILEPEGYDQEADASGSGNGNSAPF